MRVYVTTESSAAVDRAQVRRVGRADRRVGRAGVHGGVREREAAPGGGQVRDAGRAARAVAAGGRRVEARPSKDPFRVQGTYTVITNDMHYFVWHTSVREYRRSGGMVRHFTEKHATLLCAVMCRCLDVSFPPLPKAENDAYISSHILLPVTCFIKLRAFIISFSSLVGERR